MMRDMEALFNLSKPSDPQKALMEATRALQRARDAWGERRLTVAMHLVALHRLGVLSVDDTVRIMQEDMEDYERPD